ncbi:hypothetical protein Baya_1139 [Bagarius yarrelli]|uniref:Uncharacterized protein n=1 Tax=Bagarius yarrelli TaxID=175774 RepID=A0A556TK87_BAGYA|nr:hypothetical protein Baya_1139 [Bagarius yarrelli]
MARAISLSITAMVAAERHLWLSLSGMVEKNMTHLLDSPVANSGLFYNTVQSVFETTQEANNYITTSRFKGMLGNNCPQGDFLLSLTPEAL